MTERSIDLTPLHESVRGHIADITAGADLELKGGRITWSKGENLALVTPYDTAAIERLCQGLPDGVYRTTAAPDADTLPRTNPWAPGSFNLTEQLRLKRESPEMARHLAGATQAPNPFAKGPTFNLTEQIRIKRENPGLAAELKAKAGTA
ncbi:hypothetical protein Lcho_2182 [Leptothrix cholodnii SP-6]|uniref:Uncharacterized protein n=1 Tax=Leptothrix cholodnii (strain ATCC 51168 / LMG 8142 / SP-6) TaxID=395495 RepID=B1Y2V6_LEPCP|nr:hypothetical protein [Leptothrix cholodnii]ACB34448.1 hypothetical protein Lcho_2182 [Leptothrix cholodnii SP-6]